MNKNDIEDMLDFAKEIQETTLLKDVDAIQAIIDALESILLDIEDKEYFIINQQDIKETIRGFLK